MKRIAFALSLIAAFVLPMFAMAHPGHGEHGGYTIIHYFTAPTHVFASLGVMAVIFSVVFFTQKRSAAVKK